MEADRDVIDPAISATGRFVIFRSCATTLVPGGQSGCQIDIYLRDRDTDDDGIFDEPGALSTIRASVDDNGSQVNGEHNWAPDITPDGRYLAFASDQFDLAGTEENCSWGEPMPINSSCPNVFVRDRDTDGDGLFDEAGAVKNTRVSVSTDGTQSNGGSYESAISADGRHVAFLSGASNLVMGDTNPGVDVFVRDRDTDGDQVLDEPGAVATVRVSESSSGMQANAGSTAVAMSANGRYVAFSSQAFNPVAADGNFSCDMDMNTIPDNCPDIFVRDRDSDADGIFDEAAQVSTIRASVSSSGVEGDRQSNAPVLSADGSFVAFESFATNLVPGDTNDNCNGSLPNCPDIFVRDLQANTTVRVSLSGSGDQGNAGSFRPAVSAGGRFVGFQSAASNFVRFDTNGKPDAFLRDRDFDGNGVFDEPGAVSTMMLSVTGGGVQANSSSAHVAITPNGCKSTFDSFASNLVANDTNGKVDVFARHQFIDGDDDDTCDTSAPGGTAQPPMFGLQQAFFANAGKGIGVCPWEGGAGPAPGSPAGGGGEAATGGPLGESSSGEPMGGGVASDLPRPLCRC